MTQLSSGSQAPWLLRLALKDGIIDRETAQQIHELGERYESLVSPGGPTPYSPLLLGSRPSPGMTFRTLRPCSSHALASRLARRLSERGKLPRRLTPLVLHGPPGSGKTHILSAIRHQLGSRRAQLVSVLDLEAEHERARHFGARAELRQSLIETEVLLLDDIQLIDEQVPLQRELAIVIDHRRAAGRSLVLTSISPVAHLPGLESHLRSRLQGSVHAAVGTPTVEERRQILTGSLSANALPEEVVGYLAEQVCDLRRLQAAACELIVTASETDIPISLEIARAVVPRPEDLDPRASASLVKGRTEDPQEVARRYKTMLQNSETQEEQALALQIAIGDRLRQLEGDGDTVLIKKLEQALELLREGKAHEALSCMTDAPGEEGFRDSSTGH